MSARQIINVQAAAFTDNKLVKFATSPANKRQSDIEPVAL